MSQHESNDAAIREQAYYFWEQDGRPHGRENEYWHRAIVALTEESDADTLTKPAPKSARVATSSAPKRSAASRTKEAPSKSAKGEAGKKPKKK